jgi:fatty acid synthase
LDKFLPTDYSVLASRIIDDNNSKSSSSSGNLMLQIANILGVSDVSKLDPKSRLVDLGMDSLMGIEIKLALERDFNASLSTQEIRNLTIGDLTHFQATAPQQRYSILNNYINN